MAKVYSEKLKDPRWQKRRLEVLQKDQFTCQKCGDNESPLHVHHMKYQGEPWEAPDNYLITLCESCHATYNQDLAEGFEALKNAFISLRVLPGEAMSSLAWEIERSEINWSFPPNISVLGLAMKQPYFSQLDKIFWSPKSIVKVPEGEDLPF